MTVEVEIHILTFQKIMKLAISPGQSEMLRRCKRFQPNLKYLVLSLSEKDFVFKVFSYSDTPENITCFSHRYMNLS